MLFAVFVKREIIQIKKNYISFESRWKKSAQYDSSELLEDSIK